VSNNIQESDIDESELVAALKAGQENAYRQLIRNYQVKLKNLAYGITLDAEESMDIVQDVFLKVFKGIDKFEGKSSLYTWLRRITLNECLNWRRKWKRRFKWQHQSIDDDSIYESKELGTEKDGPENIYNKKELEKKLKQGLNILPENARMVFVLKEVEGLSYEKIGESLGISRGTVSSRLFYAREKLRDFLKKYENE